MSATGRARRFGQPGGLAIAGCAAAALRGGPNARGMTVPNEPFAIDASADRIRAMITR